MRTQTQLTSTLESLTPLRPLVQRAGINRREALAVLGATFLTTNRLTAATAPHSFVPYILGANTAISGYGLFDAIRLVERLGFKTIEVQNLDGVPAPTPDKFPGFRFEDTSEDLKAQIKESLSGFQYITAHLPYSGLEYTAPDGPAALAAVRQLESALEAAAFLGAKVAVLHPKPAPGLEQRDIWPIMIKRFRHWGDIAQQNGFQLALETGYPLSVADFVDLVQEVDHDFVGATLDVGHQGRYRELAARVRPDERGTPAGIRAYNDTNIDLIERLGGKLVHLHIHDIQPATWREHQPLIHGFVDYPRLIAKLHEIRYGGVLVFEIGGPAEEMPNYLADAKHKLEQYLRDGSNENAHGAPAPAAP
ncbi:MAG: sugar phosphate isomerase/epimerase [Planctomycetaceae bacterium]|nr:sugar phosphate isomerase/epimerase [Planctomycetales bacterium]MCB9922640.1 sugar phosphate isomerase/epimerase [Planctomycetaceae bacterium]